WRVRSRATASPASPPPITTAGGEPFAAGVDIRPRPYAIRTRMSPAHRRYLLLEQGIGAGVVNFLINALIARLSFRGQARVPLWGQQSIAGDTIATCLLLPLITCLIVTAVARRQMRSGRLAALGWTPVSHPPLGWLPRGTFVRGLAFGIVCVLVVAPPAVLTL